MKKLITIAIVLAIIVIVPVLLLNLRAKQPAPADQATRLAYTAMKSDLNGLMVAEQATWLTRGRYVAGQEEAGHISSLGVSPPVISVSDDGYTAIVEFKSIPGIRCAVGVNRRNPLRWLAKSGEIVCQ